MKSIVITGASSGIGRATAKKFAKEGWKVAATMRSPQNETELGDMENISIYQLDVTDIASVEKAAASIIEDFGTVDTILNNAGYAISGLFETATPEEIHHQFDVNVYGVMNVMRAFLPHFRGNKAGEFLNVTSFGGVIGFPLVSIYNSTKFAIEGLSEAMSHELRAIGVKVKMIEPGIILTDFYGRSMNRTSMPGFDEYNEALGRYASRMNLEGSTPEYCADGIFAAATDDSGQMRFPVGEDAVQQIAAKKQMGDVAFLDMLYKGTLGE